MATGVKRIHRELAALLKSKTCLSGWLKDSSLPETPGHEYFSVTKFFCHCSGFSGDFLCPPSFCQIPLSGCRVNQQDKDDQQPIPTNEFKPCNTSHPDSGQCLRAFPPLLHPCCTLCCTLKPTFDQCLCGLLHVAPCWGGPLLILPMNLPSVAAPKAFGAASSRTVSVRLPACTRAPSISSAWRFTGPEPATSMSSKLPATTLAKHELPAITPAKDGQFQSRYVKVCQSIKGAPLPLFPRTASPIPKGLRPPAQGWPAAFCGPTLGGPRRTSASTPTGLRHKVVVHGLRVRNLVCQGSNPDLPGPMKTEPLIANCAIQTVPRAR